MAEMRQQYIFCPENQFIFQVKFEEVDFNQSVRCKYCEVCYIKKN